VPESVSDAVAATVFLADFRSIAVPERDNEPDAQARS
jgi:hypothetical protein